MIRVYADYDGEEPYKSIDLFVMELLPQRKEAQWSLSNRLFPSRVTQTGCMHNTARNKKDSR